MLGLLDRLVKRAEMAMMERLVRFGDNVLYFIFPPAAGEPGPQGPPGFKGAPGPPGDKGETPHGWHKLDDLMGEGFDLQVKCGKVRPAIQDRQDQLALRVCRDCRGGME